MSTVLGIIALLLTIFLIILIGRLIIDWIQMFARDWRPRGVVLVVAEAAYTITDPPLKAIRKVLPPLRIGQVSLDLAFLVLILAVSLLLDLIRY